MSKFPLSYSKISKFKICPLQMEKVYVTKEVKDEGSEASHYGQRVHDSIARYGSTGSVLALNDETMHWKGLIDRFRKRAGEKYWELKLALTEDLDPCDWFDRATWMRGIVDYMNVQGNKALIIDWKTGAKVRVEQLQVDLFAAITFFHYPRIETIDTAFVFLIPGELVPGTYHRADLGDLWAGIMREAYSIQDAVNSGVFEPKPRLPFPCGYCPAKVVCPHRATER